MPEFKPGVQYQIPPDSTVEFTGNEFTYLQNLLNRIMTSPKYQEWLAVANTVAAIGSCHELTSNKLKELVESGKAIAIEPPAVDKEMD